MNVVFISGPHGCGKTAFMEALLEKSEVYIKDSFFLDFVNDLPAISHMSIFEKCLLRLICLYIKDTIMIRRCSESWITYICILRNTKI